MLVDVVVQQGGNHVVGGRDGMEISGEVEVDLLHRKDLGIATACSPALHSEAWTERRLTEGQDCFPARLCHTEGETD